MSALEILSIAAGTATTISFLPQAIKTIRTRDTKSISLFMYLIFTIGVLLWLVYGIYTAQTAIIISNAITAILAVIILGLRIRYR